MASHSLAAMRDHNAEYGHGLVQGSREDIADLIVVRRERLIEANRQNRSWAHG